MDGPTKKGEPKQPKSDADFETAISACGYGTFNFLLYGLSVVGMFSSNFETTTMSYVFPAAECDLHLSLGDKGLLNAITYAGMISSAFLWGYLCDTFGRKKLLTLGFLLDGFFAVTAGLSQSFTQLMVAKFIGGFVINGPFAAQMTYLAEFHSAQSRARVQVILGVFLATGMLILPTLALFVLPMKIEIEIANFAVLHSWNVYLLICSLPALLSGVIFVFLPESPKFLMTSGRNKEALEIFQKVYSINTGRPKETYPIRSLVVEAEAINLETGGVSRKRTTREKIANGFEQIKPLFRPPHITKIILVFGMQGLLMCGLNTLRLWLPQLYQIMNDYEFYSDRQEDASLCQILEVVQIKNTTIPSTLAQTVCEVNFDNRDVYTNSIIVAAVGVTSYVIAVILINAVGKKKLLVTLAALAGLMSISMYFSKNVGTTVALSSLFIGFASVAVTVLIGVVVDLFPTTLRTMTVSLTMMCGRLGAMSGNLIFPFLILTGCAPPFFFVGAIMIACAFLTFLLPNTDMKPLQ